MTGTLSPHSGTCLYTTVHGVGADTGRQVDIQIYDDAYTHSNQGMGRNEGLWACVGSHSSTCLKTTMSWVGADMGCQVDMHTFTDTCTHSNQGVGPDEG